MQAALESRTVTPPSFSKSQLGRLAALQRVGHAVAENRDLGSTLTMILEIAERELGVAGAAILQPDSTGETLRDTYARGLPASVLGRAVNREAVLKMAGDTYRMFVARNLAHDACCGFTPTTAVSAGFRSWCAVSLSAGHKLGGVLELYTREPLDADAEWFAFAGALAAQASVAIQFSGRPEADLSPARQLSQAQDAMVEGWSRAMDVRDRSTGEHARRVAQCTTMLGRALGVDEAELVHIRRGALLHDIGKLWIPDNILCKPGPLTDNEWNVMRRHPTDARDVLSHVDFLKPALDIPYCHHERWDGEGYPQKLRGDEIPFAARVFAVVDVWDALRSERPYSRPWSGPKTRAYLEREAGTQFEPLLVEAFLRFERSAAMS